jgi:hypothetical protein
VHLAAEADTGDLRGCGVVLSQKLADGGLAGLPPVVWVLFRPTAARRREGLMFVNGRSNDRAAFVDQQGARSPGTDIDPQ